MPKPSKPSKLEEWNSAPEPAAWLRSVLASEMGKFLMDVLQERHPVRLNRALPAGTHTTCGAALSANMTGYEMCLHTMQSLCDPENELAKQKPPTYGVRGPEDATE